MSYIKAWLKQCKKAITDREFEKARDLCNDILEEEPQNYNALVFSGLIYQHLNDIEKSELDYQKAIRLDLNQQLAWQVFS
jgi:Tfp pilus assembly protein PilF